MQTELKTSGQPMPWAFGTTSGHIYERQTGTHIATVVGLYDDGPGPFRDRQWVLDNGVLIAAAPEMLEVLQALLEALERARAVLAKAGGGK